jgi:diaminopimelate decarboxylase
MVAELNFLEQDQVREIMDGRSSAVYVISKAKLKESAEVFLAAMAKMPYGGQVKYAIKANPHPDLVRILKDEGIGVDASSYYEAVAALECGVEGSKISLTSQELPPDDQSFTKLIEAGVEFNATSLHQLTEFLRLFPGKDVGVRLNPGMGSGMNNRLTTGGVGASFGIWYEYTSEILRLAEANGSKVVRLHTHIGSGTDPMEWLSTLETTMGLAERLPDVNKVSIGGGFKAMYMPGDHDADMIRIAEVLKNELLQFKAQTGREISLEVEPGRLMVVHAGSIICRIIDKTDTGADGYRFLRVNAGMTEILRPAMYGAQHQLVAVSKSANAKLKAAADFIVVGHCCESSDCLTTAKGNPEESEPRALNEPEIDDYLVIEQAGAYCYGMSATSYNGYPAAEVVFV